MIPSVCRYVFAMGISPKHKGYAYICELIGALLSSGWPEVHTAVCLDRAYKTVCGIYGVDRRTAERCMRYAVQYAWESGQGAMRGMFDSRAILRHGEAAPRGICSAPPALADFICVAALELWESGAVPQVKRGL